MSIKVFDEKGQELNVENLDFNVGALHKQENGTYIYKPFTEQMLIQRQIEQKKSLLDETNELAIKYADGELTDEEYESTKSCRPCSTHSIFEGYLKSYFVGKLIIIRSPLS